MKLPRASMTTTLFITLVFAVDFGIARDLLTHDRDDSLTLFGLGFLPMVTLLVFVLYRLLRLGREAGAFTPGFLVTGVVSVGGYIALIEKVPAVTRWLELLFENLEGKLAVMLPQSWAEIGISEWIALTPILSLPPFLLALAGGWLTGRGALEREAAHAKDRRHRASRRPRFTLASASILVVVLAFDFGLIRYLVKTPPGGNWAMLGVGFLPIVNALALGLPALFRRRGRRGPFLVGFEVSGWLATIAFFAAASVAPNAVTLWLQSFAGAVFAAVDFATSGQAQRFLTSSVYAGVGTEIGVVVAFFTLPPLLLAIFGGTIMRKLGRKSARAA